MATGNSANNSNKSDDKGLFSDFSMSTVIASGLAAATSFALSQQIGLAGSLIGTAVGAVASAAALQVYKNLLQASASKIRELGPNDSNSASDGGSGNAADAELGDATELLAEKTELLEPVKTSVSGSRIAPADVRATAREHEQAHLRRRLTVVAAVAGIAAALVCALVVNLATSGEGIGDKPAYTPPAAEEPTEPATPSEPTGPSQPSSPTEDAGGNQGENQGGDQTTSSDQTTSESEPTTPSDDATSTDGSGDSADSTTSDSETPGGGSTGTGDTSTDGSNANADSGTEGSTTS